MGTRFRQIELKKLKEEIVKIIEDMNKNGEEIYSYKVAEKLYPKGRDTMRVGVWSAKVARVYYAINMLVADGTLVLIEQEDENVLAFKKKLYRMR